MERRALALSLGLSFLSMYLVYQYISGVDKDLNDRFGSLSPMVVASKDVLQFQTIRPTDVEVVQVPKALVPPGRIVDPRAVIDAVAAIPISKGEQILDNKIISKNVYSGLDTQVALGRRAISIPVTVKSGVGYLLRPGNRVDLASHFEYKTAGTSISEMKVFLQDLLVLAVGRTIQLEPPKGVDQNLLKSVERSLTGGKEAVDGGLTEKVVQETLNFAKSDTNFTTITLEVSPRQAQTIVYVMNVFPDSTIAFLRHSDDRLVERRPTTNLLDVMGPESYLGRGPKAEPLRAVVVPKFYDFVGGQQVPPQ